MSSPWLWFVSRAGGVVSLFLLTVVVVAGAVTAADRPLPTAMAGWVAGLHRYLTLGVLGLLTIHIGAAVIDTYVDLAWSAVIVPFTGGYRPAGVGWGAVAIDALGLVALTSWLRPRLSRRGWHAMHWLAYVVAVAAVVHAVTMASADKPVFLVITLGCGAVMGLSTVWRVCSTSPDRRRRARVAAGEWT